MITAKASREIVLDKDIVKSSDSSEETDGGGSSRVTKSQTSQTSTVMSSGQNGQTGPYAVKELEPEIEGVVVAAQGAYDPQVAAEIVGTVSVLFDVPAHKVRVVEME